MASGSRINRCYTEGEFKAVVTKDLGSSVSIRVKGTAEWRSLVYEWRGCMLKNSQVRSYSFTGLQASCLLTSPLLYDLQCPVTAVACQSLTEVWAMTCLQWHGEQKEPKNKANVWPAASAPAQACKKCGSVL